MLTGLRLSTHKATSSSAANNWTTKHVVSGRLKAQTQYTGRLRVACQYRNAAEEANTALDGSTLLAVDRVSQLLQQVTSAAEARVATLEDEANVRRRNAHSKPYPTYHLPASNRPGRPPAAKIWRLAPVDGQSTRVPSRGNSQSLPARLEDLSQPAESQTGGSASAGLGAQRSAKAAPRAQGAVPKAAAQALAAAQAEVLVLQSRRLHISPGQVVEEWQSAQAGVVVPHSQLRDVQSAHLELTEAMSAVLSRVAVSASGPKRH